MSADPTTPTPLTGGSGRTLAPLGKSMKPLPDVALSDLDPAYGELILSGWDTVQEAWPARIGGELEQRLRKAKEEAQAARVNGEGVVLFEIGGERFKLHATGASGGVAYRLENDDFLILLRSSACEWGCSVRYLSAGLWEHGWHALRERAGGWIAANLILDQNEPVRISRADYAFDFQAPGLTAEMVQGDLLRGIVCHSSTKRRQHANLDVSKETAKDAQGEVYLMGTSARFETLTIGKVTSLQVTVYDKAKEITEISGKEWFADLWAQQCEGVYPDGDMWRLEIRMGGDWLKNRNANTYDEFHQHCERLITEGLYRVRATPSGNRQCVRNRPMHPIWSEAVRCVGAAEMLPIGRRVTGRREALSDRMAAQLAGSIRSGLILEHGDIGGSEELQILLRKVEHILKTDPDADRKERAAKDRYSMIDEAS